MSDASYPSIGLRIDLNEIAEANLRLDKLRKNFDAVGDSSDRAATRVTAAAGREKRAVENTAAATAKAERQAAQEAQRAAAQKERNWRYLQGVRIRSIQMEQAAQIAAQRDEARRQSQMVAEAERAARAIASANARAEREAAAAAAAAAREKERTVKYLESVRINSLRMEAAARAKAEADAARAAKAAAAEQERIAKYLQSVKVQSLRMEMADRARAEKEAVRAAREAAAQQERAARQAAAEQERIARYLTSVRLESIRMEQRANAAAARERAALEREWARQQAAANAARLTGGGAGGGGGGGGLGGLFGAGGIPSAFISGIVRARDALGQLRRLFFDVRTAVGLFLGSLVVRPLIQMADAMTALQARVSFFAAKATDVPYLMEAIYKTAQDSRAPLTAIATLYTRLAPLAERLGRSQTQILGVVGTIAKGIQIGGATPAEATSSSQQLAQALASNRLGGDELRSLAENAPILMAMIAKQLNMNSGEFIKWAHQGKANAEVVVGALEKARAEIDRMFKNFPMTIGQASTVVGNAFTYMVGRVNEATKASQSIANAMAKFAAVLERQSTIDAMVKIIEGLGTAMNFLGGAMRTVLSYAPAIITLLAAMGGAKAISAVLAMQSVRTAMLGFSAAAAVAGRASAAMIVAQSAMSASAAMLGRSLMGLVSLLGGPLGVALIAVAFAYNTMTNAQKAAAESAERLARSTENVQDAFSRSIAYAASLGAAGESLTKTLLGIVQANGLADGSARAAAAGQDVATQAAIARAEAERASAAAIMTRQAIEMRAEARTLKKSTGGLGGALRMAGASWGDYLTGHGSYGGPRMERLDKENAAVLADVAKMESLARALDEGAAAILNTPIVVTKGDSTTPPRPSAGDDKGATDAALNRIAKMRAELVGLQEEAKNISADPLSALAEQINRVGKEAAAQYENGKNQSLAATAYTVAAAVERQKIHNRMLQDSAEAQRAAEDEAAQAKITSDAQIKSDAIMRAYWSSGTRSAEGYMAALKASRDAIVDSQIATANLGIAARYGVTSIDGISEALVRNKVASLEQAEAVERAARAEAEATANNIRRGAENAAAASRPQDEATGRVNEADELVRTMERANELAQTAANSIAGSFGTIGDAIANVIALMGEFGTTQAQIMKTFADDTKDVDAGSEQWAKAERRRDENLRRSKVKFYGDTISAAKSFFKEGSKGYAILEGAERAYRAVQFALALKAMLLDKTETGLTVAQNTIKAASHGVVAVARALASLPFPANLAAGAATAAALAAIGVGIFGGGARGPGNYETAEQRQAKQGTGSVLGMPNEKSESLVNAMEIVAANSNKNLEYSNGMLDALKAIQNSIGAVALVLARQLSMSGGVFDTSGLGLGEISKGPGLGTALLSGGLSFLLPGLFGKRVTTTLEDQGLNFVPQSLGQITANGLRGNTYQDVLTRTKKKFLGITTSDKTRVNTVTAPLDGDLTQQITLLLGSLKGGVQEAAAVLGVTGAEALLNAMTINIGRISFKDMTGEEIQAELNAVFGKVADDMAATVLPAVAQFQKAGEGTFETLTRLAREYQVVDITLAAMGMTFKTVGISSIAARNRLVELAGGLDQFTEQAAFFAENFLSEAERMAPIRRAVTAELARLGLSSVTTREQFKNIVLGLDLSTQAGAEMYAALMNLAPAFAAVTDSAAKSLEALQTLADFIADLRTGPLSPYAPVQILGIQQSDYASTLAAAQGGDAAALQRLPDAAQAYLESAQQFLGSSEAYAQIFESVQAALQGIVDQGIVDPTTAAIQQTNADLQNALRDQTAEIVGALEELKDQVAGMTEAVVTENGLGLQSVSDSLQQASTTDALLAGGVAA